MPGGNLVLDIETHEAGLMFSMPPEKFVRLIGYKWVGDREVTITTSLEEIRDQILSADLITGHNIHAFDLRAIFGPDSNTPYELTKQGRVFDTWTHAILVNPAPAKYIDRHGQEAIADKPERIKKWLSLDEQAFQLGVPGKTHDLKELAIEFGDPNLTGKDRIKDGLGRIPVDDPRYIEYLKGDVLASQAVARKLWAKSPMDRGADKYSFPWYCWREQCIAAAAAIISSNGFRVDAEAARRRVKQLEDRRNEILAMLAERYGFPTEGESPWATNPGKQAIMAALADHGITPDTVDWPKTDSWASRAAKVAESKAKVRQLKEKVRGWQAEVKAGELPARSLQARERWIESASREIEEKTANPLPPAFGLSLSGETLINLTKGTPAEEIGQALAELKGQRSLAQLALDSMHPDGFAHPEITMLQRSGRWSTTEPGLTVWTARGEGAVEKSYFLPDTDDEVLLEIDYSNADARIVACLSGDAKYAERFQPGADGHMINAIAAWGKETVEKDPKGYRQKAKAPGHGWNYSIGAEKAGYLLGAKTKEEAIKLGGEFVTGMNQSFKGVTAWKKRSIQLATKYGYLVNDWGRIMPIEKGREFTQGPALLGQSGTREIMCDALLRMPIHWLRRVKAQIHDALVFSVPRDKFEQCRDYLVELMSTEFKPRKGGQRLDFPVDTGPPGANWYECGH